MLRQAKNRATNATPMKIGRYGSSAVRLPIQAPLMPSATKTSGPRQQVEARTAAMPPAANVPRLLLDSDIYDSFLAGLPATVNGRSVVKYGVKGYGKRIGKSDHRH